MTHSVLAGSRRGGKAVFPRWWGWSLFGLLGTVGVWGQSIVPDGGSQTAVDAAPNGVPVVNVAPPTPGGVSHNTYQQFGVGAPGAILNNSRQVGPTQLGGALPANPHLTTHNAQILLNEVTSPDSSTLAGYLEVFGPATEVIIANPNGITCRGCGFINTSRLGLITGRSGVDAQGALTHFTLGEGEVLVEREGMDGKALRYVDVIARLARFQGPVQVGEEGEASELTVLTGNGTYHLIRRQVDSNGEVGEGFSVDAHALGALQAGTIWIASSELGLGVKSEGGGIHGLIRAHHYGGGGLGTPRRGRGGRGHPRGDGGDDSPGRGSVTEWGGSESEGGGAHTQEAGTGVRGREVHLQAQGLENRGLVEAREGLTVHTDGEFTNTASGESHSEGAVTLTVGTVFTNAGAITARGSLVGRAGTLDNQGQIRSAGETQITASQGIKNTGTVATDKALRIEVGDEAHRGGFIQGETGVMQAGTGLHLMTTGDVRNAGEIVGQGFTDWVIQGEITNEAGARMLAFGEAGGTLRVRGRLANAGELTSGGDWEVEAGSVTNTGAWLGQGRLTLTTSQGVTNRGRLQSQGTQTIHVRRGEFTNTGGVASSGALTLVVSQGELTNTGDAWLQGQGVNLSAAGAIQTQGIESQGELVITGGRVVTGGAIRANGRFRVQTAGAFLNTGTVSAAGGDWTGGSVTHTGQIVVGAGGLALSTSGALTLEGIVHSQGEITTPVRASSVTVGGDVVAGGAVGFQAESLVVTPTGVLKSGASLTLDISGAALTTGALYAKETLSLATGSWVNAGEVLSEGVFQLTTTGDVINRKTLQGAHLEDWIIGGEFTNEVDAQVLASSEAGAALTVAGTFTNAGTVASRGDWGLEAITIQQTGVGLADGALHFTATQAFTHTGTLQSTGAQTLTVSHGSWESTGRLVTEGLLTLAAPRGDLLQTGEARLTGSGITLTAGGRIQTQDVDSRGFLTLTGGSVTAEGEIRADGLFTVHTSGALIHTGTVSAEGLDWTGGTITLPTGSRLTAGEAGVRMNTPGALTLAGGVHSQGGVTLPQRVASLTVGGAVLAAGAVVLQATGAVTVGSGGGLKSGEALTLDTRGAFVNAGRLYGQETLALHAETFTNLGVALSEGRFRLTTTGEVRNEGRLQGGHLEDWVIGGEFTNAATGELLATGAGVTVAGTFTHAGTWDSQGDWIIEAGRLENTGTGGAAGQLVLTAGSFIQRGRLAAGTGLHLQLTEAFTNAGELTSGGALTVGAPGFAQTATGRLVGEPITLQLGGGGWENAGVVESSGDVSLTGAGAVTNTGTLRVAGEFLLRTPGTVRHQGIWEAGTLTLTAGEFLHDAPTLVLGTGASVITVSRAWTHTQSLTSQGRLTLQAPSITNDGLLVARDGLTLITADTLRNRQTIASGGALTLRAGRLLQNEEDAELYAGGDLLIEGVDGGTLEVVRNVAGTIEAEGSLTLRAEEFHNEAVLWEETPGGIKDRRWVTQRDGTHAHGGYWWTPDQWVTLTEERVSATLRAHQAIVRAGGDITIVADTWNETSVVSAGGGIHQTGSLTHRTHTRSVEGLVRKEGRYALVPYRRCSVRFLGWNCRTEYTSQYDVRDTPTAQVIETEEKAVWLAGGDVEITGRTLTFGTGEAPRGEGERPVLTAQTDEVRVDAPETSAGDPEGAPRGAEERPVLTAQTDEIRVDPPETSAGDPEVALEAPSLSTPPLGTLASPTEANAPLPLNAPLVRALSRLTRRLSPTGLFRPAALESRYAIETRPEFTDPKRLLGSTYLLERLGIDPEALHRVVGDGLVQSRLLRAQVEGLGRVSTLRSSSSGWRTSLQRLYEDTAVEAQRLTPDGDAWTWGVGLTPAQVNALRQDVVWYVFTEVGGKTVLVPQLYVASRQAKTPALPLTGSVLAGRAVTIKLEDGEGVTEGTLFALERLVVKTDGALTNRGHLLSGGPLTLHVGGDFTNAGGVIESKGEALLVADGAITLAGEGLEERFQWEGATQLISRAGPPGSLLSGGDFLAVAGGSVTLGGRAIHSKGALTLIAGEDITLGSVIERTRSVASSGSGTRQVETLTHRGSTLEAKDTLTLQAGRDLVLEGSELTANQAHLTAGRHLGLFATQDFDETLTQASSAGGLLSGDSTFEETRVTRTHQGSTLRVNERATLTAHRGDILSEGATLTSEGTLSLRASQGTIGLFSVKDTEDTTLEANEAGAFWFSNERATGREETIRETNLTASRLTINATEGIQVTYHGATVTETTENGDLDRSTETHAAPDWVAGAQSPTPLTLTSLTEYHGQTREHQQGMTGLASLVINAAVSAATGGVGGVLTVGMSAGAASVTSAALTSLATQGALGLINHQGDLGATLKGISLTGVLTAGALGGLDVGLFNGTPTLGTRVLRAGARAGVRTVLTGVDLKAALASEGAGALGEVGAKHLGIAYKSGTLPGVLHKAAHGALGCVTGALQGDCASGAIGAVVGEVTAEAYLTTQEDGLTEAAWEDTRRLGIALSRLAGGVATQALGGDAALGAQSAENAAQHNALPLLIAAFVLTTELVDKGLIAYDVYQLGQALAEGRTEDAQALAEELAVTVGLEATIGSLVPGSMLLKKAAEALRDKGFTTLVNRAEALAKGSDPASPQTPSPGSPSLKPPEKPGHTPSPTNTPEAQQQAVAHLFDDLHGREDLTIGSRTYRHDGSPGGAKVFEGVSQDDIFQYFEDLTGQSLPEASPLTVRDKVTGKTRQGVNHIVKTPHGNFNLRDVASSGGGVKWTIDIPASLVGRKGKGPEIKFK